ncbi:MAG: RDD family protein [Bdellovibrionota bacterium]
MRYNGKMQFHPKDLSELDELTEEHLGFSALSDGLGFSRQAKKAPQKTFDSFDQPLPRARDNELQRKAFSGTGAVAAGPARPAPMPAASRSVPAPNVLAEPAAPRHLRLAAFAIDLLIIFVPMSLAWWFSFSGQALAIFNQDRRPPLFLFSVIFGAYFLLSESFGGQSLGKMVLGLRVVEDDKYQKPTGLFHAATRLLLFTLGAAFFGLGLLASLWDSKRRPWHDRYSGSIVRKKA